MLSHFFIDRPIFAAVISILIVIMGGVAMWNLPIAQYPEITPPQIQITASYPGANAEVVSQNVAAPIEQQVNGADDMIYMYSTSSSTGNLSLNVFFNIGRDPDLAQVDLLNRINLALPKLPQIVTQQGISVKKVSTTFLMIIAIYAPEGRFDPTYVANYANLYVLDEIKRIPGANQASIFGNPDYAMRLWIKPDRMAQLGITTEDVVNAVKRQNEEFAVGRVGQPPMDEKIALTFPATTKGRLTTEQEFEEIILRSTNEGSALLKLKDIGRAELGAKDYSIKTRLNGKEATLIAVFQQPGANALQVSRDVTKLMENLKETFPDGIDYKISMDTTKFVEASIHEVIKTLLEASVLVIAVVLLFLGSLRATLVPLIAIPVSIIGAFIGMFLFGFSINMLTLFGLVLAIGTVVDDAIVVMENVERNMNAFSLSSIEATKRAMTEVTGPVIATTLVTIVVYIPVAFLGGITGQLYKQFAITISVSVFISSIVALTLCPALAARLLKSGHQKMRFFRWFDRMFEKATAGYIKGVNNVVKRSVLFMGLFGLLILGTWGFFKIIPTSFVPAEDQGYLFGVYSLPDSASLERTAVVGARAGSVFMQHPAVKDVATVDGYSLLDSQNKTNAGTLFVALNDYGHRKESELQAPAIVKKTGSILAGFLDAISFPINPPPIPGLGSTGGFDFWLQNKGDDSYMRLNEIASTFIENAKSRPEIGVLTSTINAASQQLLVELDREKSELYGVPIQEVYQALQTLFGSIYVSQFNKYSRLWQVIIQAESSYRTVPSDIEKIYVRNNEKKMVPLSSLVSLKFIPGPDLVTRFNSFPAAKIIGSPAQGYSTGQAIEAMEQIASEVLPSEYGYSWSGLAFEEKKSGSASSLIFVFGMIMVFLILAAQYEKWSLPFAVMMALPFGILGALVSIWIRGLENDVYFQIGLVTLLALAAKNAILIIEFAVQKKEEGLATFDAAMEASRLRLRPICMTAFSFILGCIPLAIATGASANSRHSIGTGVIGGMIGATVIAVFFIPLFYVLIQNLSDWARRSNQEKKE